MQHSEQLLSGFHTFSCFATSQLHRRQGPEGSHRPDCSCPASAGAASPISAQPGAVSPCPGDAEAVLVVCWDPSVVRHSLVSGPVSSPLSFRSWREPLGGPWTWFIAFHLRAVDGSCYRRCLWPQWDGTHRWGHGLCWGNPQVPAHPPLGTAVSHQEAVETSSDNISVEKWW